MTKQLVERVAHLEAALQRIIDAAPQEEPEAEDYDDTESAYNNGQDNGTWSMALIAKQALEVPQAATPGEMVAQAIQKLRQARDLLVAADAPNATERVRLALKSAEGAERNAGYRQTRAQRNADKT